MSTFAPPAPDHVAPYDVAVVGAGALGAFHALALARRGLRVLLLERNPFPREASVRNFGMVFPAVAPEPWLPLALHGVEIYEELRMAGLPIRTGGNLCLAETELEAAVLEEMAQLGPSRGIEGRLLTRDQAENFHPLVEPSYVRAALHLPLGFRVEPRQLFPPLIRYLAERYGVEYRPHTPVIGVESTAGGIALRSSTGERFTAERAFVCQGSQIDLLFPQVWRREEVSYCKLLMLATIPHDDAVMPASIASGLSIRRYPGFAIAPSWSVLRQAPADDELLERGIHILAVADAAGRIVLGDSHESSRTPPDDRIDAYTEELILAEARRILRLPTWEIAKRWYGVYLTHPSRPVFEETIDERIHLISAIGGKGMTCSPGLAEQSVAAVYGPISTAEGAT